jgi:hypothetical protein
VTLGPEVVELFIYAILSIEPSKLDLLKENPRPVLVISIGVKLTSNLIRPEK